MIIFPEIRIARGRLVASIELPGGLDDPVALVEHCAEQGAQFVHVVDLDQSAETGIAIRMVIEAFPGHVQLETGSHDPDTVEAWFDAGVSRLALGGERPDDVVNLASEWPGGIAASLSADNLVDAIGFSRHFARSEVASVVLTDRRRHGTAQGCDIDRLLEILHRTDIATVWRGGVRSLGEIRLLALQEKHGLEGVICGRALLEGPLDLPGALAAANRE